MVSPRTQLSLFGESTPAVSVVELDADSWVEHHRRWYAGHDELFVLLAAHPEWERRQRWMFTKHVQEPRSTLEYQVLAQAPPALVELGATLSERYGVRYDSAWLNLYRDHQDSTAWHADRRASQREQATVPVLSLGETRRFLLRHRDGGPSTRFDVDAGDLIVMRGRCQRDWVHCVPKETQTRGMRISVNFGSSTG